MNRRPYNTGKRIVTGNWRGDFTLTTAGLGTLSTPFAMFKRLGDTMFFRASFLAGTVAASTAKITIPQSLTIDVRKLNSMANGTMVGIYTGGDGTARSYFANGVSGGFIFFDGSDTANVYISRQSGVSANTFAKENGSAIFASGQLITLEFSVPILQWA